MQFIKYVFHGFCLLLYIKRHGYIDLCLLLTTRNFIFLIFTFKSIVHFVLISMKGIKSVSKSKLLHTEAQLFQHDLLRGLYLFCCIAFAPLTKICWLYLCESTHSFLFCSIICLFFHQHLSCLIIVALY